MYLNCYLNNINLNIFIKTLRELILKENIHNSLKAFLLELPSRNIFENLANNVDPILVFNRRKDLMRKISLGLQEILETNVLKLYNNSIQNNKSLGERFLLEKLLKHLILIESPIGIEIAKKITTSKNMTLQ